ncbi:MAG: DNA photolyase family protein [Alphaproteobacteria bacterium]|jgi:deoxyribodipyrimidine photo-lyase|nr:DNA photolyase family protein [Alphaproteobacteria bacterium]
MNDSKENTPVIMWFRQDLRLTDNPALSLALSTGKPIIPLFILEEGTHRPLGAASRWWLHHSLKALEESLQYLCLRQGNPEKILKDIIAKTGANKIFWTQRFDPFGQKTDAAIEKTLTQEGLACHSLNSNYLLKPGTILNNSGKPFQIFTPYWKQCADNIISLPTDPAPTSIPLLKIPCDTLEEWKLQPSNPNWAADFPSHWKPGEKNASSALEDFVNFKLPGYAVRRNLPDQEGTSRLSPHLHWGEISPRQVWNVVQDKFAKQHPYGDDVRTFLSELGWREFAQDCLLRFPNLSTIPLRSEFNNFPWEDHPKNFLAWQRGQTGYPIVDAGMRQLWKTGWMHNRVRMIVASFLVKDLLIPWQKGEAWFWDTLVDADEASNAMNWQWVTGCGVDAAPFFRIFNPVLQGEKFDPEGNYIRKWLPELKALPNSYIHKPWLAPSHILQYSSIQLNKTYPSPIVDHKLRRQKALMAFKHLHS